MAADGVPMDLAVAPARSRRLPALVLAVSLVVGGCSGSGSDVELSDASSGDLVSADALSGQPPCEGGAFPGDDEFRELLCDVEWTQLQAITAGLADPGWQARISTAILGYADDRNGAINELTAVLAEMRTALDSDPGSS